MFLYSQISCKVIGKVLYNSTFKGRENRPIYFITRVHMKKRAFAYKVPIGDYNY